MEAPIFVLGCHKSGTSLLRSLFDGHPDLSVLPIETHPFEHLGYWINYPLRRRAPKRVGCAEFIRNTVKWVEHCNSTFHPHSDGNAVGIFDVTLFDRVLRNLLDDQAEFGDRRAIECYYLALEASIGLGANGKRRFVEKSVENFEFAHLISRLFHSARFVHIVRNPYANLVSMRRYYGDGRYPYLYPILRAIYWSYYFAILNNRLIDRYMVVRYEDLLRNPKQVMLQVAEHCSVEFEESLTEPTRLGCKWRGNSTRDVSYGGVSDDNIGGWKEEVRSLEVGMVNTYLAEAMHELKYDVWGGGKYKRWLPIRGERLENYVRNRVSLFDVGWRRMPSSGWRNHD